MSTYTKQLLSASVNGKHIAVVNTTAPGTVVHVSVAGTSALDEIWLYCCNNYGSSITATLWWGSTTASDQAIFPIANGAGRVLLADGMLINNTGTVGISCAYTGTYGLVVDGFVNRIM